MMKPTSFIYLFLTSSLAFGLMSCNKKSQSTVAVAPQAIEQQETPTMAQEDNTKETVTASPDVTLTPDEPEFDKAKPETTKPVTPAAKPATPPAQKTEPAQPATTKKPEEPKKTTPPTPAQKPVEKKTETKPVTKPVTAKKETPKKEEEKSASNFIIAAYKTMVNEGKKIGAACNFYLERVLEVMGFKTVDFLANDFDVAAKKMFKSYKVFKFTSQAELKRHLWSYRERTGFILQWERVGAPGHVAIVERIGEKLYIYQASLNKYTARLEETTIARLLAVNQYKGVRVYSDLQK